MHEQLFSEFLHLLALKMQILSKWKNFLKGTGFQKKCSQSQFFKRYDGLYPINVQRYVKG